MASIFTRIMDGEVPGRFVWKDEACAAFLTIAPLRPGHTLVVPRKEVDHWLDLDEGTMNHLVRVARAVGQALMKAYAPSKVGMMIAGLEVRHVHLHVVPIDHVEDLDFARQDPNATAPALDEAAGRIREALRALGFREATA